MQRAPRDTEPIVLAIVAALPFYFNAALSLASVALFHAAMFAVLAWRSRRPDARMPRVILSVAAVFYLFFYFVDGIMISRSLIRATGHLLFFIAAYQAVDRDSERNHPQRLLVIFLIAIASIATSTHITIIAFVAVFAFLLLRQLIAISREESARIIGTEFRDLPANRSAATYLALVGVAAIALFPLLPRVRNPFVRGVGMSMQGTSTGFSEAIDFNSGNVISPDPRVVARVTVPQSAVGTLTPLRLRGGHYDRYLKGRWTSRAMRTTRRIVTRDTGFNIATPVTTSETVKLRQTRNVPQGQRLYLPVGTWQIRGLGGVVEGPNEGTFMLPGFGEAIIEYEVDVSSAVDSFATQTRLPEYDVEPGIQRLADSIAGSSTTPRENAAAIASHLSANYSYVPSPVSLGQPVGVEQFLLSERRGHCEHFAAGMVLLLAARDVPARVVGGYYGGEYNPLGGYFVVRQRDAHAWVEVWDGTRWTTWDPTPSDLRPGSDSPNFITAYLSAVSESINFFWDRYVLTFGLSDQVNLILAGFYAARDVVTQVRAFLASLPSFDLSGLLLAFGVAAAIAAIVAIARHWRWRASLFDLLSRRLARIGLSVAPSMTGAEVVALAGELRPAIAPLVGRIITLYERDRFSTRPMTKDEKAAARMALREIK